MITYAEHKNEMRFDWNDFLAKENYTLDELSIARMKSNSWVTCACGNQCDRIARNWNGSPNDTSLENLGLDFNEYIIKMSESNQVDQELFEDARQNSIEILDKIEVRSAYLLRQLDINN